jgi:cell division protein FtsB
MQIPDKIEEIKAFASRYKFGLAFAFFVIWMIFFDNHNYFYQKKLTLEKEGLEKDRAYFLDEIEKNKERLLKGDKNALEKFAREKYLMKRDDEIIFIFVEEE